MLLGRPPGGTIPPIPLLTCHLMAKMSDFESEHLGSSPSGSAKKKRPSFLGRQAGDAIAGGVVAPPASVGSPLLRVGAVGNGNTL